MKEIINSEKVNILMEMDDEDDSPLFWSDEVARMYPRDVANAINTVSMEDVVGPWYVRPLEHPDQVD